MKLGIIGNGVIVQEFLPRLIKMKGIEILGIQGEKENFDSVKKMCRDYGISIATYDFNELCSSGIDTVYVAVPNFLHYSYCKKSLEIGLNVIVEKPITSNYKEAIELKNIAKSKNLFLFEAITTLYLPNFKKIQEWLPRIGNIKIVQSRYSQYSSRYDAFKEGVILPAFDFNKSGGALMDLGLYNIHYVMGLFGNPKDVKYYANIERSIDTSGVLILQYADFLAVCIEAKDCKGEYGGIIQGTDGCIKNLYPANLIGEVILELNDGTIEKFDDGSASQRLIPEFKEFIRAINEKDLQFCYEMLDKSLSVCNVTTKARIEAGIIFPADDDI